MIISIALETTTREELIDVTSRIEQVVLEAQSESGIVHCFVPHTTAAITINENADPDVKRDMIYKLAKVFPKDDGFHHAEGNSDAHIKASLIGSSETILFEKQRLVLGQWQGVFFCEFDGPRHRQLIVKVASFAKD